MDSRREEELLTGYLERLRTSLEALPKSEREEAYQELAQHVDALVEAEVRTGGDREAAIQAALQKFGDPEKIGQKIVSNYWTQAFRVQPKRQVYQLPDALLGGLVGLCAGLSVVIEHTFQFSGFALIVIATAYGSILGIATGWQWARMKRRDFEKRDKTSALQWMRNHPVLTVLIGMELLIAAIFGARIVWATNFTQHWTLSATMRHQVDRSWEFCILMLLSNVASGVLFRRFFLLRQGDDQANREVGE